MTERTERLSPARLVIGLALVAAGIIAVLEGLGAVSSWGSVVGRWWPMAVVTLGFVHAWTDRRISWGSITLMTVGGALVLSTTGVVGGRGLGVGFALVLIALGLAVIVGWGLRRTVVREDVISRVVVGSTSRLDVRATSLRRVDLTVIAGSARIDLSDATLDRAGARISVSVMGGAVEIIVPEGWRVVVRGLAVLGGWDDTTSRRVGEDAPQLEVRALTVLGGVDVRHRRRWT